MALKPITENTGGGGAKEKQQNISGRRESGVCLRDSKPTQVPRLQYISKGYEHDSEKIGWVLISRPRIPSYLSLIL